MRANWIPRLENEEADALTNWDFRHFDPARRLEVDLLKLEFVVMNELMDAGERYLEEVATLKAKSKEAEAKAKASQKKRPRKGPTLRERDPW